MRSDRMQTAGRLTERIMDWLVTLFTEHSAIQAVVVLSLIATAGILLGKVRIGGISLGVTFVFSSAFWPDTSD